MELIDIMGFITTVVTLGMFMTGFPPCLNMYKTGDTKNIPFLMFLIGMISGGQMLHYSLMLDELNMTLLLVNGVGVTMQIIYVTMYLLVDKEKSKSLSLLGAALGYNAALYYYMYYVVGKQPAIAETLGGAASVLTTIIVCLPVFEIIQNIRNKNADGMPMIMLIGGLACGVCWLIFGLMLGDPNVWFPNVPGIAINVTKITVVQMYQDNKKKSE